MTEPDVSKPEDQTLGEEIIEGLADLSEAIESGEPLREKFKVTERRVPQSFDSLYNMSGPRHAQDEPPKYAIGEAFTAACEALGDDTTMLRVFCGQLTGVVCEGKSMDDGHKAVVKAWKGREGP